MTSASIEELIQRKVGRAVRLDAEGIDRYRVFTPLRFDDGDHLAIVLRREGDDWVLSDEGHTLMHLSYDLDTRDLMTGSRQKIINNALNAFSVEQRDGEIRLVVPGEDYGNAFFSFAQALLKITDVSYLSRERVRSTFFQDFRQFISETVHETRRVFDWNDPTHDREKMYSVDCRVNSMARPLFLFALPSDDKVRDVTITLLQFEKWDTPLYSIGIFEDQEQINRKVLARFTDVCERQYSSLGANRQRIADHIRKLQEAA